MHRCITGLARFGGNQILEAKVSILVEADRYNHRV
jgi:hypothetical protein